ncbi:MAG: hypothetical protein JST22_00805 [Bacteroidetes bacterium]|nr:hypothetical protein [Bacteroidota bacterium]
MFEWQDDAAYRHAAYRHVHHVPEPEPVPGMQRAVPSGNAVLQRLPGCACGGGCPRCSSGLQPAMAMRSADGGTAPQPGYAPEPIDLCIGSQGPPQCTFTQRQQHVLTAVHYDALAVTSRALMGVSSGDPYMATLARRIFHVQAIDMQMVGNTIASILNRLRSVPITCGSCTDDTCNTAGVNAYTKDDLSGIVVCQPRFFANNLTIQRRTLIHEAAHAAGIDQARVGQGRNEQYCREDPIVSCADPCGNLSGDLRGNVDAWARYIECASFGY